jgi:hypothetical protein
MLSRDRYHEYASDPAAFRRDLIIDRGGKPACLGECLDDWQRKDFEALDGAWLRCVGYKPKDQAAPSRAWLERPRGHSKSSDIAVMAVWALAFAPRNVRGFAAAGDRDQAKILRDAIQTLVRLNPMLGELLEVQAYVVKNVGDMHPGCGSQLEIISSDVATSFGLLGDFFVADEPTHWDDSAEQFWVSLLSAAAKRQNALLIAILNAGWRTHWTFKIREAVRDSERWYFSHLEGCCASWIDKAELAEQERLLPLSQFDRLWRNLWQDEAGDALPPSAIRDAVCRVAPMTQKVDGWLYVACLDLSWKKDASALVLAALDFQRQKVVVAAERIWRPRDMPNAQINFQLVVDAIRAWKRLVGCKVVIADSWQSLSILQQLEVEGFECWAIQATAQRKVAEAKALLELLDRRQLETFDGEVAKDLRRARTIEKPGLIGGVRIELPRTEGSHCDALAALLAAAPSLQSTLESNDPRCPVDDDYYPPEQNRGWGSNVERERGWGPVYSGNVAQVNALWNGKW